MQVVFFSIVCEPDAELKAKMTEYFSYSEKELLLKIMQGDENAFNVLYDNNWQKVYSYIEPIVKSEETAEEIVIDIFVGLWQSRERLGSIDNLGGFLRTVSRNKALDFLKMTSRRKQRERMYRAEIFFRSTTSTDERVMDKEIIKICQEAISRLSPQRRKIFLMHREDGLKYNEIAEKLKISSATVKKTMSDALNSINEFLQTYYGELGVILLVYLLRVKI